MSFVNSCIYVPTQVGTLDLSSNQCSLGSTYVNTNLSVDPFDAIFDPTGNPGFKIRLGMVGLLSAVKIKSNTGMILKKPKFKQTIYQLPSMILKLPAMLLDRRDWGMPPTF